MKRRCGSLVIILIVLLGLDMSPGSAPVVSAASSTSEPSTATPEASTARADFDGDGDSDLAVGLPFENVVANPLQPRFQRSDAGAVHVVYGGKSGSSRDELWHQGMTGGEAVEADDHFGYSVAADDFDGDGFVDLAIGAPGEDLDLPDEKGGLEGDNGVVHVLFGSADGLASAGSQVWSQYSPGVEDDPQFGDGWGTSLAAGDLNGDARADLAVGVPAEIVEGLVSAGGFNVLYGGPDGLTADLSENDFWSQATPNLKTTSAGHGDHFGEVLAIGFFNGDGYADLAVGAPRDEVPGASGDDNGTATIIYGSSAGLVTAGSRLWHKGSPGIAGGISHTDFFGASLAVGNFGRTSRDDLAIGAPGVDFGPGEVHVLFGSSTGLSSMGAQLLRQGKNGLLNDPDGYFGYSLAAGDLGRSKKDDLAVGAPTEDFGTKDAGGLVHVIYGSDNGLTAKGDQVWHQNVPEIKEQVNEGDRFGLAVAVGDFGKSSAADLVVGVPCEDLSGKADGGAANILFGSDDGLRANDNRLFHQDVMGFADSVESDDNFGMSLFGTRPTHLLAHSGSILDELPC